MKQKYTLTVAGQPLTFVSDEDREFVKAVVSQTDKAVTDIMMSSTRCARLDAALITALEYCSEKTKAEKKIKSLEAQISLYEATIARMKNDAAKEEAASKESVSEKGSEKEEVAEKAGENRAPEIKPEEKKEEVHASREEQLKEIEDLLKLKKEESIGAGKQMKLDEIASLLGR